MSLRFKLLIRNGGRPFLLSNSQIVVFIMLINVKMPTMVGILTFMSMINFMLSSVEHETKFITIFGGFVFLVVN